MIVSRKDPRDDFYVISTHVCGNELVADRKHGGAKRRQKVYHTLTRHQSGDEAFKRKERLEADALVMAGSDVEAMRQCTIDAGHANPNLLRSDCDADELRLLYNPRKDVAVLRFATPIDFDALLQADDVPDFARTAWEDRRVFVDYLKRKLA